jgi:hypothetical protein
MSVVNDQLPLSPKFSNDATSVLIFLLIMAIIGAVYSMRDSESEKIDRIPPPPPRTNCTPKENLIKNDNRLIKKLISSFNKVKGNSFRVFKTLKKPLNCIYKKTREYINLCSNHNMCNGLVLTTHGGTFFYVVNKDKHEEKGGVQKNESNEKEKKIRDVKVPQEPIDTFNYSTIILAHQNMQE